MAPLAFALAFHHARRALGARRAAAEMAALVAYGFTLEAVAMAVFASHAYDASWRAAPLGVPLAVAVVWAAVITSAMAVAGRREATSSAWRAGTAALIAITLDLMIEPVAARASLWHWTPPGPWLGVPIGNFVGWGVIVGAYAYGAARWAGTGPLVIEAGRRVVLAAACILALMLVGAAWRSLGVERLFDGGRGWVVWAAVLAATLWRVSGVRDSGGRSTAQVTSWLAESTLPALLARAPGRGPEAALGVVALAFAVEALLIGEAAVTAAAAGSLATMGIVAIGLRRRPA